MPSVSKKQHNLMAAVAHNPAFAKKVGIPQSVGIDFNKADKGRKFGKGGETRPDLQKIAKPKTDHGKMALFKEGGMMKHDDIKEDKVLIKRAFGMHDKQLHESKKTDLTKLNKGGVMKAKETMGPRTMAMDVEKGSNKLLKFGESAVQKRGHTKGKEERDYKVEKTQGGAKGGKGTFGAAPIKMAKGGMCGGGKTMKKMSTGGMASKRADGIASKGKTKGKMC
jgi:hypothetical protein